MATNNWGFVIAGYAVTWIVVVGYLVRVHRLLSRARTEHDAAITHAERTP
jgi:CcmD family protein